MTTPSNPPDPPAESTAPGENADPPFSTPPATEPPPAAAVAPAPYQPGYQAGYQVPPAYPFAPVARPPRVPWVNPARRAHVVAVAIAGALLFGGCGLVVGHVAAVNRGHRDVVTRFEPGPGGGGGNAYGHLRNPRIGPGQRKNLPNLPAGPSSSTPVPTPSASSTR